MRRKTLDALLTSAGVIVAIVLFIAGGLLTWSHAFINDQVKTQLSAQQIYFPQAGSDSLADPAIGPYLNKYAGQQLTNGEQAKAYADHYIAVHIAGIGGGKTYSQLSTESRANPSDTKLAGTVDTVFKGETLRGMLLNAYAFWKIGQIALYAAWAAFAGGALMLLLSLFGGLHGRKVSVEAEVFPKLGAYTPIAAGV